jgi:thiazole synthase
MVQGHRVSGWSGGLSQSGRLRHAAVAAQDGNGGAMHDVAMPVAPMGGLGPDSWQLAGRTFHSRLLVGTGKYATFEQLDEVLAASGAEIVTVSLRRVDMAGGSAALLDVLRRRGVTLLPNTSGCYSAADAVRTAQLAREAGLGDLVKLEVIGDPRTLFPDNEETLIAARELSADGFAVLPYCGDDVVLAQKLQDAGCVAIMPLAAPIGSGLGLRNPHRIALILETVQVPVLVDAGIGTASDVAIAMELGCSAVLLNTAIAEARDPVRMAHAMRLGVMAGRLAATAGRMPKRAYATASSPLEGLLGGVD